VHCRKDDAALIGHLKSRGFREFHGAKKAGTQVIDDIRQILKSGALKGELMNLAHRSDRTGALAQSLSADPLRWLHDRAQKGAGEPSETRWSPRDERRKYLRAQGYTAGEIDKILE
jgi:hypothetical protein